MFNFCQWRLWTSLIVCLLLSAPVYAESRETLFDGFAAHGGFGGVNLGLSRINSRTNTSVGGRGAWLVNHRYFLGAAGYGSVKTIGGTDEKLSYGGVWFGRMFDPFKMVHYSLDCMIGLGRIHDDDIQGRLRDTIFVVEPAFRYHLNVTHFAEMTMGLSLRLVSESNHPVLTNRELRGLVLNIGMIFGKF